MSRPNINDDWYRDTILYLIDKERSNQINKWGLQDHLPHIWLAILMEEVGELARALNDCEGPDRIQEETIQVAAVAATMLQNLKYEEPA